MARPKGEPVILPDQWRDIPGYEGLYQVNDDGQVRSIRRGKPKIMKPRFIKENNAMMVWIDNTKGKRGPIQISRLVMDTFIGPLPAGMCRWHKNGDVMDNRLCNLTYVSFKEVGKRTAGRHRRRAVAKVNFNGRVIETYKSVTEASKANFLSDGSIINRCKHKIRDSLDGQGYTFMYLDDLFALKGDSMEW